MNITDTFVVVLSDLHSGSTRALFPNKEFQFEKGGIYKPDDQQLAIWRHFEHCTQIVREARRKKRLIVVHDGDAVEGSPFNSTQFVTRNPDDQVTIHVELMDYFLREVKFDKKHGDRLYYVKGTEVHAGDKEHRIGKDLGAEQNENGFHAFDKLELVINGCNVHFVHHGPSRGKGPNAGNGLRNWLRNVFYDCIADGLQIPNMIITGHTHQPCFQAYIQDWGEEYRILYGIICPSWQLKTRFAYKVAPIQLNKIGLVYFEIDTCGNMLPPRFEIMKNHEQVIKV